MEFPGFLYGVFELKKDPNNPLAQLVERWVVAQRVLRSSPESS